MPLMWPQRTKYFTNSLTIQQTRGRGDMGDFAIVALTILFSWGGGFYVGYIFCDLCRLRAQPKIYYPDWTSAPPPQQKPLEPWEAPHG